MLIKEAFANLGNSANQTETKAHVAFSSNNKFGIEIELEGATSEIWNHNFRYWRAISESSLRNAGIEFVLKRPLNGDALHRAINELYGNELFQQCQVHWRGGIHIHIDVRNWDQFKLAAFVKRYYRYETKIFEDFGHDRWHSNFCIPLRNQYQILQLALGGRVNRLSGDCNKYSALNFRPMRDLGSIEWRGAASTQNIETMRSMIKVFCGFINDADDYVALSPEQQKEYDSRYFSKMERLSLEWLGRGLESTERNHQYRQQRNLTRVAVGATEAEGTIFNIARGDQHHRVNSPNLGEFTADTGEEVDVRQAQRIVVNSTPTYSALGDIYGGGSGVTGVNPPAPVRHVTSVEDLDEEGWSGHRREVFIPPTGEEGNGYWTTQRYHNGMGEWIETSARVASPGDAETPAEEEESGTVTLSSSAISESTFFYGSGSVPSIRDWTVESSMGIPSWTPVLPPHTREPLAGDHRQITVGTEDGVEFYIVQFYDETAGLWQEFGVRPTQEEVTRHRRLPSGTIIEEIFDTGHQGWFEARRIEPEITFQPDFEQGEQEPITRQNTVNVGSDGIEYYIVEYYNSESDEWLVMEPSNPEHNQTRHRRWGGVTIEECYDVEHGGWSFDMAY